MAEVTGTGDWGSLAKYEGRGMVGILDLGIRAVNRNYQNFSVRAVPIRPAHDRFRLRPELKALSNRVQRERLVDQK